MIRKHPLTRYREKHGLSIAALAQQLECTDVTVWRYETGKREPRGKMRRRISEITGIPESKLVAVMLEAAA